MRKSTHIVRYTADEITEMRARGEDKTDLKRLPSPDDTELETAIEGDDEGQFDWSNAQMGFPRPKQQLTLRLDQDVIDWFKGTGKGYQTRMNAVLRRYVSAQKH